MEQVVDTVIIGGGPAGISCAIRLQKAGVPNLVIEKKQFPREKTCGGMVTEKTVQLLLKNLDLSSADELQPAFCDESTTVKLYCKNELLTLSQVSKPFRFVKRAVLDAYLANEYQKRGGRLMENTVCESVDVANHALRLSNGDTVAFRHLVVADGALSETGKMLGCRNPKLGFCVETDLPKTDLPDFEGVGIYFGVVKKGYAWAFPSGEDFCIGLGGVYQKGIPYNKLLDQFLLSFGIDPQNCPKRGAFVPYGKPTKQPRGLDDVILVGDAGGFVDPIYGEGLYFAAATGTEAANAILENPEKLRPAYRKRTARLEKTIRQGNRLQTFFFNPAVQKLFQKVIRNKNAFVGFYCDHQISEYNYSYAQLWKLYRAYKKGKRPSKKAE